MMSPYIGICTKICQVLDFHFAFMFHLSAQSHTRYLGKNYPQKGGFKEDYILLQYASFCPFIIKSHFATE